MPNAASVLRDAAVVACKTSPVAAAAGLSFGVWADANAPRVFASTGGFIGGRNRGRLPFVEIAVNEMTFDPLTAQQDGTLTQSLEVKCHVGGTTLSTAEDQSERILAACMVAIRAMEDGLAILGGDRVTGLVPGPCGHVRTATLTVVQSYHRDTYEAT